MSVFVLVHGTTAGGWVWRDVRPHLEAAGHHVYTPTLTGLGERVHLAHSPLTRAERSSGQEYAASVQDLEPADSVERSGNRIPFSAHVYPMHGGQRP
jgi:hypothetical protein